MNIKGNLLQHKFLLALSFLLYFSVGALAQNNIWSFEDNPSPRIYKLTPSEEKLLNESLAKEPKSEICKNSLAANYKIYNDRYPDFRSIADEKTRYKNWKLHLLEIRNGATCIYNNAYDTLKENVMAYYDSDFYYCGRFSRLPTTPKEVETKELMVELVDYVRVKPLIMSFHLLILNKFSVLYSAIPEFKANGLDPLIKLNPDVEYFLRKSVQLEGLSGIESWDMSSLMPLLSKEKIAFLDEAANNEDFDIVLDNTAACEKL